jgi:hypothetical protein
MCKLFLALAGLVLAAAPVNAAEECEAAARQAAIAIEKVSYEDTCTDNCAAEPALTFKVRSIKLLANEDNGQGRTWKRFMVLLEKARKDGFKEILAPIDVYIVSGPKGSCRVWKVEEYRY